MPINEFEVIKRYFQQQKVKRSDVIIGSGDDCAVLQMPANQQLAVSMDTLIADVHFPSKTSAYDIGYKALAVNLSDLAAMGAEPAWFTCALTLPDINTQWLTDFAAGMFDLANVFNVQLVGGDLTRGYLSITIQVHGFVPPEKALQRTGAGIGDRIYVSGRLGAAGLALKQQQQRKIVPQDLLIYLNRPYPQIALGLALRGKASSAIDISDGLIADLQHILQASRVGANIYLDQLPLHPALQNDYALALTAGDDYQLCFTASSIISLPEFAITAIGHITSEPDLRIYKADGTLYTTPTTGYQHF